MFANLFLRPNALVSGFRIVYFISVTAYAIALDGFDPQYRPPEVIILIRRTMDFVPTVGT
jgi:hypothetical protein